MGKPVVKQISILSLIIQIIYIIGLSFLIKLLFPHGKNNLEITLTIYLILCLSIRYTLTINQRKGIRFYKKGEYNQAISEFLKSYDFFTKHTWLDKYRYIILMSGSRTSYKELALVNAAFCYSQIGDGKKSKEYYEKALAEFPKSEVAKAVLNLINSVNENIE